MPERFKMVYHARRYISALLYLLPFKTYMGFWLKQKSMTLNDLERKFDCSVVSVVHIVTLTAEARITLFVG